MVFYTNIINCTQAHVGNNDGVDIFARNYEIALHQHVSCQVSYYNGEKEQFAFHANTYMIEDDLSEFRVMPN